MLSIRDGGEVAHPYPVDGQLHQLSAQLDGPYRSSLLAIGPEGGFTDSEVELLMAAGWSAVGLAPSCCELRSRLSPPFAPSGRLVW